MWCSEYQREENYKEYLRLLQDNDYSGVTFDEESGGVSAVHNHHKFSKQKGAFGMRQGDYELNVIDILRKLGHRVVLGAESNTPGIKSFDGFIDDIPMEIKAIEGNGAWSISTKLHNAVKQHAQCVVLYFTELHLFSKERLLDGIGKYLANPNIDKEHSISSLMAISNEGMLAEWDKKATPIEGWSV